MNVSHVFFQVKISTKTFRTDHACVWFDFGMRVHMKFEIIDLMKSLIETKNWKFFAKKNEILLSNRL